MLFRLFRKEKSWKHKHTNRKLQKASPGSASRSQTGSAQSAGPRGAAERESMPQDLTEFFRQGPEETVTSKHPISSHNIVPSAVELPSTPTAPKQHPNIPSNSQSTAAREQTQIRTHEPIPEPNLSPSPTPKPVPEPVAKHPKTPSLHISLPSPPSSSTLYSELHPHTHSPTPLTFLVGLQDPSSRYFTRGIVTAPSTILTHASFKEYIRDGMNAHTEGTEMIFHLPDLDPDGFATWVRYVESGLLPSEWTSGERAAGGRRGRVAKTWQQCYGLLNAHMFGTTIGDVGFADRVMDVLVGELGPGVRPDRDTVVHVFAGGSLVLKRLVVDWGVGAGVRDWRREGVGLPGEYVLMMLEVALEKIAYGGVAGVGGCEYHVHKEGKCHRNNGDTECEYLGGREEKEEGERKEIENGVIDIAENEDREGNRVAAGEMLGNRHGKMHIVFRRLDADNTGDTSLRPGGSDLRSELRIRDQQEALGQVSPIEMKSKGPNSANDNAGMESSRKVDLAPPFTKSRLHEAPLLIEPGNLIQDDIWTAGGSKLRDVLRQGCDGYTRCPGAFPMTP